MCACEFVCECVLVCMFVCECVLVNVFRTVGLLGVKRRAANAAFFSPEFDVWLVIENLYC